MTESESRKKPPNLTFRIPDDVAENLEIISRVTGITRSQLVLEGTKLVIDKYVNDPSFKESAREYLERFNTIADELLSQPPIK